MIHAEDYRDFRVTNNTDVLQAFQEALEALPDRYIWANSTLDDTTSANTEIPTSPASSPNGAATSTDVLTISGLSNEVVTATITELETPTYSGGMANLESESTDQSKADNDQVLHEDPDDDDSSAPGTITSFGLGFTAVFATVLFS